MKHFKENILKIILTIIVLGVIFLAVNDGKYVLFPKEKNSELDKFTYQTEQFADIKMIRYKVPGFDDLDWGGQTKSESVSATGNFISNPITAPSSVSKMGAIITYEDTHGTNALNTDIVLQLSADNGTNFTTATMTAMPDFASGIKMAKVNDLSVTASTQLKYKISFANQAVGSKEARIRGVSLQY